MKTQTEQIERDVDLAMADAVFTQTDKAQRAVLMFSGRDVEIVGATREGVSNGLRNYLRKEIPKVYAERRAER